MLYVIFFGTHLESKCQQDKVVYALHLNSKPDIDAATSRNSSVYYACLLLVPAACSPRCTRAPTSAADDYVVVLLWCRRHVGSRDGELSRKVLESYIWGGGTREGWLRSCHCLCCPCKDSRLNGCRGFEENGGDAEHVTKVGMGEACFYRRAD
jgi:hypothetical protein